MTLFSLVSQTLAKLVDLLNQLDDATYTAPCQALSNASIGQHTRHIIELFQCLLNQYETGIICYDKRARNAKIESETEYAISCIETIQNQLFKEDKLLVLAQFDTEINSNYYRELLYNWEHCIHHQALIKVAVLALEDIDLCPSFGVAPSTLAYRKQIQN